jgi:hypothetical protein
MAPKVATRNVAASQPDSLSDTLPETPTATATIAAQQAEIDRLNALLQAQAAPTAQTVTTLVESIVQSLRQTETAKKSTKIPDPPALTDGKEPTFESWKIQITGKLTVNADHFANEQARITYVFGQTGGDAQKHLNPRIGATSAEPFLLAEDMIQHLSDIYEDPFRVQNARKDYRKLVMKPTETFTDFYTRFLHLAGEGQIPEEDLRPDLYDKLTLELQRAIAPTEETLTTVQDLQRALRRLDQNLRQIRDRADRVRARNSSNSAPRAGTGSVKPPSRETTPAADQKPVLPDRVRPVYGNANKQALSNQGACFACGIKGHFAKDCPQKDKALVIQEVDTTVEGSSGKEEP